MEKKLESFSIVTIGAYISAPMLDADVGAFATGFFAGVRVAGKEMPVTFSSRGATHEEVVQAFEVWAREALETALAYSPDDWAENMDREHWLAVAQRRRERADEYRAAAIREKK